MTVSSLLGPLLENCWLNDWKEVGV